MKKKEYIAPECLVVEVEMVNMRAGSVKEELGGDKDSEVGDNDVNDFGANRHRGEWGDLWAGRK